MDEKQSLILEIARTYIGTPYKYAATPEEIPRYLDCSSFTQHVYKQMRIEIPRSTILQAAQAGAAPLTNSLQAGDLLFFRGSKGHYNDELFPEKEVYIGHVAMYAENGNAIHATSRKGAVVEEKIEEIIENCGPIAIIKRIL